MPKKVVIIGGVAGGASAAARLRRIDEEANIVLFEKGEYISFANCGLPYYIGEVIKEKEKLVIQTPEKMKDRFCLDVRVHSEVIEIDTNNKQVKVKNWAEGNTYFESYDKLILAPGADPLKPSLPGIDSPRIFTLKNIPDTYAIKEFIDQNNPKCAVVIGGGFIGLEMAENLHHRGLKVSIVQSSDHVIRPIDFDMASMIHTHLKEKQVDLYLNEQVSAFHETEEGLLVALRGGRTLKTDIVLIGIGVRPDSTLAIQAGLKIGLTGGIWVNESMQTSNPDIYAVGDAVEVKDFMFGDPALIPLAGPANKQGRIAADNICGRNVSYRGTMGTAILKVFDLTVAMTGSNTKQLKNFGSKFETSITHSSSHAGYYPGASILSTKVFFETDSGKILGAQMVGAEGVDKRMDVIATAIQAGLTVFDLETLELSYAPPYSSAKDPVNISGFVASNILKGDVKICHWEDIQNMDLDRTVLLDVRSPQEYALGSIPGAFNIPVDELRQKLTELPKNKDIVVFCQVGLRGYLAYRILVQRGFQQVKNLSGGYKTFASVTQ